MNIFEQNARSATIAFRNGRCNLEDLAKATLPLINKLAAYAAYKLRMDVADDLAMSVWIAFQTKGVHQWGEDNSIGGYLSSITRNEARNIWNIQNQYAAPQLNEEGEEINTTEESADSASIDAQESLTDIVAKKIAIGAIKSKLNYASKDDLAVEDGLNKELEMSSKPMGGMTMQTMEVVAPPVMPDKKGEGKKTYELSQDQQELTDIYHRLRDDNGMTQSLFAEKLRIGSARLASYLYGRTSGVPKDIMDDARALLKGPEHIKNHFDGKSMKSIIRSWAKKLGVDEKDDSKIAALVGINVSTICRWRNEETRPNNVELIRYTAIVDEVAARINKAVKSV